LRQETADHKENCNLLRQAETIRYDDISRDNRRFDQYTDEKTLLTQRLIEVLNPNSTTTVLDIGAGEGYFLAEMSKLAHRCTGVEPDPIMLERLLRRFLGSHNVEIDRRRFEDFQTEERFDAVVSAHTLSFFEDKLAMIAKMASFAREGGLVVIVAHSILGRQYQILEQFDRQFRRGRLLHVSAELLCGCLESLGVVPKMDRVLTKTILPSLDIALSLGYFLFRQDLDNQDPMAKKTAMSLLLRNMVNHEVQIDTIHGVVSFRKTKDSKLEDKRS